mmetsp:Transcript_12388/g.19055  ORF Transcript_12388/g.19055 Transcript_12388/m.19055 type:complete len:316 (+) Transcript_12388:62-1009(+)
MITMEDPNTLDDSIQQSYPSVDNNHDSKHESSGFAQQESIYEDSEAYDVVAKDVTDNVLQINELQINEEDKAVSRMNRLKCIRPVQRDLKSLLKDPLPGIFVVQDEARLDLCHALINGPSDTPYEFGWFYFQMKFPGDYPHSPPEVQLKTTGGGRVRFNPNLYKNGRVCLSILGTWEGPSWSPAQTIGSTLLSIQSLLNFAPLHNEPGFEDKTGYREYSKHYNQLLRHETIRVAVLDMLDTSMNNEDKALPVKLAEIVRDTFLDQAEYYKYICDEYSFLDGRPFQDSFFENQGKFCFSGLQSRIEKLEEELRAKM